MFRLPALWVVFAALSIPLKAELLTINHTSPGQADPSSVPIYEVFELTIGKAVDHGTHDSFESVALTVEFFPPTGPSTTIHGFYYFTNAGPLSLWKARFAPDMTGTWTYTYTLDDQIDQEIDGGIGTFECISGSYGGFLRFNQNNDFRWVLDNGEPFFSHGVSFPFTFDTGDRRSAFGTNIVGGESLEFKAHAFSEAGFRLARFRHIGNHQMLCADDPAIAGDNICETYLAEVSITYDRTFQVLRENDIRVLFSIFGNAYDEDDLKVNGFNAENERLVEYCINRWGAYVDLWELGNENEPGAQWEIDAASHVQGNDPYGHPVSTSYFPDPMYDDWPQPLDYISPHWYLTELPINSASEVVSNAAAWKSNSGLSRPVVVGEQGNQICDGGGQPIPSSASCLSWRADNRVRMRARAWTAFFEEVTFMFFQNGGGTDGNGAIYIGRDEREDMQVLTRYIEAVLRTDSTIVSVSTSQPTKFIAFGLESASASISAAYVFNDANHSNTFTGSITMDIAADGTGYWLDPATGQILQTVAVTGGAAKTISLPSPGVTVDLAFFTLPTAVSLDTKPIVRVSIANPQDDMDLDDDGLTDYGPSEQPFGKAPLTMISFNAEGGGDPSVDWDSGSLTYSWDLGDGCTDTGSLVFHDYGNKGNYVVTLTATDDEGDTAELAFVVRPVADLNQNNVNDPPIFNLIPDQAAVEGTAVHFVPKATDREHVGMGNGGFPCTGALPCAWKNDALDPADHSASSLPGGALYEQLDHAVPNTTLIPKEFLWVPGFGDAGNYTTLFDVMDPGNASAQQLSVDLVVSSAPAPAVYTYGTSKINSMGGAATLDWSGSTSVGSADFRLQMCDGLVQKNATPFWGQTPACIPFLGATLWTQPPLKRLTVMSTDMSGKLVDYDVYTNDSLPPTAGETRYYQVQYRDPGDAFLISTSNAMKVTFTP